MLKNIRKLAGISLFEMLLVMVIISMIVVAGIRYVKHQQEISAAKAYGVKLYTFGQAVNKYVTHSQALRTSNLDSLPGPAAADGTPTINSDPNIQIGTDPATGAKTITIKGTNWLDPDKAGTYNKVPFLDEKFTFSSGMAPLIVARDDDDNLIKGDEAFTTVISFADPANPMTSAYNISISAGVLYREPTGQGGALEPMAALSQDAVKHANELYTSYQGAPAITYSLPILDADGNYAPAKAVTGTLSTIAQSGDAYLRIDGNNFMEGSIRFNPNTVSTTGLATIEDVNAMNFFAQNGAINNLNKLAMVNAPNSPSEVTKLSTLTFAAESGVPAKIDKLKTLNFTPGGTYHPARAATRSQCTSRGQRVPNCIFRLACTCTPALPAATAYTEGGAEITGLNTITFDNTLNPANSANTLSNLNTLSFQPSKASNLIENVGKIKFVNQREFSGLTVSATDFIGSPGAEDTQHNNITRLIKGATSTDVCFPTGFKFKDGDGSNDNFKACMVYKNENDEWIISGLKVRYCAATCLRWTP
jgi:competence protein ComGC